MRLRDGSLAVTWALLPGDREGVRAGYEQLSPEAQFHRFLAPVPHLTEGMLEHLVDRVDGVDHIALVLFVFDEDHVGQGAGIARIIRYPEDPEAADVAVTVLDSYQGRGVATALLAELMRQRPEGIRRLVTQVAADNPASLAMLRRLGPTTVEREGGNLLAVTVELPPAPGPPPQHDRPGHPDGPPDDREPTPELPHDDPPPGS